MREMVVSVCANVWQHIQPSPKPTIRDICLLGIYQRLCGWRVICNYIHVPRHKRRTHKHTQNDKRGELERIRENPEQILGSDAVAGRATRREARLCRRSQRDFICSRACYESCRDKRMKKKTLSGEQYIM